MRWTTVSPSQFPWEQEALDFVRQGIHPSANLQVWSNFEFVADNGSIYEVDMLCVGPWGAFLVEIKSRPGTISGMGNLWSWNHEGRSHSDENPLLLANRKCKVLASLLGRQKAFARERVAFIEPLVFCSHPSNHLLLADLQKVCVRSTIVPALTRREGVGLKVFAQPPINTPGLRTFLQAVTQSGIEKRPVQSARRAGDYRLETLFHDSPTGSYQDWIGQHATSASGKKLIRLYLEHQKSTPEERQTIHRAAEREYQVLNRLDHPGILRAETLTPTDVGHALVFRFEPAVVRLDQFLVENNDRLSLSDRIDLVRQIADAVAYAHRRRVVHRAISPQSILVTEGSGTGRRRTRLYNFQVSLSRSESQQPGSAPTSRTLHATQLLEDASTVYLAPEMVSGQAMDGEELDSFSLGAVAYLIFSGLAPGVEALEMGEGLANSASALDLRAVLNGVPDSLAELIRFSANADRSLRYDAGEFLAQLDKIEEELTAPDAAPILDPREAGPGDELLGRLKVRGKLGSGSVSTVLLVEGGNGQVVVLKVASRPEYNVRLREEYEILRRVRHANVVAPHEFLEFGDIHGFTMDRAGEETLAQRLRKDGKLEIDLLERFGEELLQSVDFLDKEGIAHRDIKPDNLGVRSLAKGPLRLLLFDFSLSSSGLEEIGLGTPPYLDPFLAFRKVKRWDAYAERFSAAMTLYEMATGATARWGQGNAPQLVPDEVSLDAELFPAPLRETMVAFFQKALRRDFQTRFDNAEQMRAAWKDIFRHVDQPALRPVTMTATVVEPPVSRAALLEHATPETQLLLLGLSTRLVNTLDRLELVTVNDLLAYPLSKIHRMRGVGNKTRRELADLVTDLRRRFPTRLPSDQEQVQEVAADETAPDDASASIDLLARHILGSADRMAPAEKGILQAFVGLGETAEGTPVLPWISQSDLAPRLELTRARVGQVVTRARERWLKMSSISLLRETVLDVLNARGGVVTQEELVSALLGLRGSALPEPERRRMASVVARVGIETEQALPLPRFQEQRRHRKIFLALGPDFTDYAIALGQRADALVAEEPLPPPARVLESLQAEPFPVVQLPDLVIPDAARLVSLASSASETACANARLELYPRNLEAARALRLAQGALFGSPELTVGELRERVISRYREAEPLPDRPALDTLLEDIGSPLQWSVDAREGQGAYIPRPSHASASGDASSLHRAQTIFSPLPRRQLSEDVAEAMRLEEKLRYAERQGSFLVLAAPSRHLPRAEEELANRFQVERLDGDALFLTALKAEATKLGIHWQTVLLADAGTNPQDWERLQMLVARVLPSIRARLQETGKTILLTHPGLFSRYRKLDLFQEIRANVGTPRGPHGLWMTIPSHGFGTLPKLNGQAIPITNPAQFEILNEAWIANQHRGVDE
jgi:serine/threonine protein kinase